VDNLDTLSITLPVPAVQGYFGKRIATYSTQIRALEIKRILGHDPRSRNWKLLPQSTREIYEKIQRVTSKDRREGVAAYIEQRLGPRNMVGAFPAISIGVTHRPKFDPFPNNTAIGVLHLEEEVERIILDGLGRVSGCMDLAEESAEGKDLVRSIVLPVTFYVPASESEPLTLGELGQLFMDFNFRVHPVPARIAIALDQSDIYITLANALAKEPFISNNGGMETKAASRGKKSTAIVVQGVLLRAVRGACEGRDFQESNLAQAPNPVLTDATFQAELNSISSFFTEIAHRMGKRWTQNDSLHLTAPGWQALGVIHYDMNHRGLNLSPSEKTHIFDVIGGIDWTRTNKAWVDDAALGQWAIPKGGTTEQVVILGAGRNNTQAIIDYLRKTTGLQAKLDALAAEVEAEPAIV